MLYDWPKTSVFRGVIPKSKIYEHAEANKALKNLFVTEVEQIVWSHKLAKETINLEATKSVREIQVVQIVLKIDSINTKILQAIDKAIPFPILFELSYKDRKKLVAAYKRPSESDSSRRVISDYFYGEWQPSNTLRIPMPVALNLSALYEQILNLLIFRQTAVLVGEVTPHSRLQISEPDGTRTVSLEEEINHAKVFTAQVRTIKRIKAKLKQEKQFNKRVVLNRELRTEVQNLEQLISGSAAAIN